MVSHRLFRFSLRTFLVFISIVAVWLGIEVNRGRRQQAAITTIRKMGGSIYHRAPSGNFEPGMKTSAPAWLVKQVGDGFFGEVERVHLAGQSPTLEGMRSIADLRSIQELNLSRATLSETTLEPITGLSLVELNLHHTNITDRGLRTVGELPNLRVLRLYHCPHVTDAGLREIKDLELEELYLQETRITGEGLVWIRNMKGLEELGLSDTPLDDIGLLYVSRLPGLRRLDLARTKVTNAGVKHLMALHNLERLDLRGTLVSDFGLIPVGQLSSLRTLDLAGTEFTNDGLEHLTALTNLEYLNLDGTKVSDPAIPHLHCLEKLKYLQLGTGVTSEGIAELQEALPGCTIYGPPRQKVLSRLLGF